MMKKMTYYLVLVLSLFLLQNCNRSAANLTPQPFVNPQKNADTTSNIITPPAADTIVNKPPQTNPVSLDSNAIQFEVIFSTKPNNAILKPAKLKYDKSGWVSGEWDDNSPDALKALEILKNFSYTDGCGNKIQCALAVAVNGRHQWDNREFGLQPEIVNYPAMKKLIENGWDIENHSYYHGSEDNYNFGTDWLKNIRELDDLIFTRIGYRMNGAVVPTNYENFPTAAKNFGYLFSTSQGTHDGFAPAGNPVYKDVQDFALAPEKFSAFNRMFFDDWAAMESGVKKALNEIVKQDYHYFRFASHTIDAGAFERILNSFNQVTNDRILMLPTREIMEYRIMTKQPIEYTLENNKLIVKVDLKNIPSRFRWRDLSFLLTSDQKISAVNIINNIDKITFNKEKGLINIFSQQKKF